MKKHSRRYQEVKSKIVPNNYYSSAEAMSFLKANNQEKSKNIKASLVLNLTSQKVSLGSKIVFQDGEKKIKSDKSGNIQLVIGKSDFSLEKLEENYKSLYNKVISLRPINWKGKFLNRITLSTTMGPGVKVLV